MDKLKNFKIGKKLSIGFGIVIAIFCISITISLFSLLIVGSKLSTFYNSPHKVMVAQLEMRKDLQYAMKDMLRASIATDTSEVNNYIESAESRLNTLKENVVILQNHYLGDQALVTRFNETILSSNEAKEKLIKFAKTTDIKSTVNVFNNEYAPILIEAENTLIAIGDDAENRAGNYYKSANITKFIALIFCTIITFISFGVAIFFCKLVTKSITDPLSKIENAAKEISLGNLNATITYESEDELGSLANSMRMTTKGIQNIISDIAYCLGAIADGNFSITTASKESYIGAYAPILEYITNINTKLSDTLNQIKGSINQVSAGAQNIAEGAQDLAQGATDQASSIQELLAIVNELTTQLETSAIDSKEAALKAEKMGTETAQTNAKMNHMTEAMDRINQTSSQIELIINTIEDIASQTNLLSLNAAIEAARAGEAGKGFAVVADEIRKLANQSAEATNDTRNLIQSAIKEVNNGNTIVLETSDAIQKVVDSIKEIILIIEYSKTASISQAASMKQINHGIEQISTVVQNNSATAEESSATSEEFYAQAEALTELINQFALKNK